MNDTATYCPEDNKLRLYVGRVPNEEYKALRAQGWTSTPKQDCDFVATWTPEREDMALTYADLIEDEDQGPDERAADRAERFSEYRDKRTGEATGHADSYDAGPSAHGFQSQARGERAARRHDRKGTRAVSAWEKADYWTSRTAGVISHALYVSTPAVRMGRIKTLESELRKIEGRYSEYEKTWNDWKQFEAMTDPEEQTAAVRQWLRVNNDYPNNYQHPTHPETMSQHRRENGTYLSELMEHEPAPISGAQACALWLSRHAEPRSADESRWAIHLRLRLAYENQMLEAQGGRAAHVEMIPGGWIMGGRHMSKEERQIQKVNKSPKTGRVVSVLVRDNQPSSRNHWGNPYPEGVTKFLLHTIETERLPADAYRPPTAEELEKFNEAKKARKAAAPKVEKAPLINPTDEDAQRLQDLWNAQALAEREAAYGRMGCSLPVTDCKPQTVCRTTQANYSAASQGTYKRASIREVFAGGFELDSVYDALSKGREKHGREVCQVRRTRGEDTYGASRVIILTDKPQKPLPARVFNPEAEAPAAETDSEPEPAQPTTTPAPTRAKVPLVLWGRKPDHAGGQWIKLEPYSIAATLQRRREGWETTPRAEGIHPEPVAPAGPAPAIAQADLFAA